MVSRHRLLPLLPWAFAFLFAARPQVALAQTVVPPAASHSHVTFIEHVAPILMAHCIQCHRPNGAAFSLLTYEQVRPRAKQIARVTRRREMPPWKPEPGYGEFVGARRLSEPDITLIGRWAASGALRGNGPSPVPGKSVGDTWQLGPPDLIVRLPEPYTLRADGPDVFRTFVLPVPLTRERYVRAWEFRPHNPGVVHHATIPIDSTDTARMRDEADPEPGYDGLIPHSARNPDGYFLGWTPGQSASTAIEAMPWRIGPGDDLVFMLHLRPSGRPEIVDLSFALYFTDTPPTRLPAVLRLGRQDMDIPAGESRYVTTDSYTLPVDVEAFSVQPHAHNLAREIKAFATLPDGSTRWLIYIRDWDFHWQDIYRFVKPAVLPAGTRIEVEFTYDNSGTNPRNPTWPPVRVSYGQKTTDEMGDLWIQLAPINPSNLPALQAAFSAKMAREDMVGYETMLRTDPRNVDLHDDVALLYQVTGDHEKALAHFLQSLEIRPSARTHQNVGAELMALGLGAEAETHFRAAIRLDFSYAQAHHSLATFLQSEGNLTGAEDEYQLAVQFGARDARIRRDLGRFLQSQGRAAEATAQFEEAVRLQPESAEARLELGIILAATRQYQRAVPQLQRAARLRPSAPVLIQLAWVLATAPDGTVRQPHEAIRLSLLANQMTGGRSVGILNVVAASYAAAGEFEHAVETAETALALATEQHDENAVARIRARREQYLNNKPTIQ